MIVIEQLVETTPEVSTMKSNYYAEVEYDEESDDDVSGLPVTNYVKTEGRRDSLMVNDLKRPFPQRTATSPDNGYDDSRKSARSNFSLRSAA